MGKPDTPDPHLLRKAKRRGLSTPDDGGATRHVVFCTGSSCGGKKGKKAWKALDRAARALEAAGGPCTLRTETECFGLCRQGPLAVVYPEGTWYHSVGPRTAERIVLEHVVEGRELDEHVFARNPLGAGRPTRESDAGAQKRRKRRKDGH
jgi:(2Fe-2S) ferredoxin